jgi:hypothetical protein
MNVVHQKHTPALVIGKPVIGRTRSLFFLCIALIYGFVLSQLPNEHFKDFNNYLVYADSSLLISLRNADGGIFSVLSNEPVWLMMNAGLNLFLEPVTVVRAIIFFGAFSLSWLILRNYPQYFFWLIFFLFLPQIIKNYLIHLRQGIAIAVFLWGWFSVNRSARWLLLCLTPFIHASFFFILALFTLTWILRSIRFSYNIKTIAYISVGVAFSLSLSFFAELLGARQAEELTFERESLSGLGFVLWVMILGIMLSAGKTWLAVHAFESGIVTFYLSTYWLIEVSARIFESGLIVILLAGLTLRGWRRYAFLGIVLSGGMLSWLLRISQPALGFFSG